MQRLEDKVAIVTGASSGIGRAAALLFAREGARVVVAARRESELRAVVDEIGAGGGVAVAHAGDVRAEAFAQSLVRTALERFGRLDVAINNAGTLGEMGPTTSVSLQGWTDALDTNLTSAFLAAKYQLPPMLERGAGSVVFTSSFVGHTVGFPGAAAYAASKSGLLGLSRALAAEYGPQGVRVNAILPGAVDTPMYRSMNDTEDSRAFITGLHALKRVASPEEIAQALVFLASDESSFITGTAMLADGGASITRT
jgi:NAD(P)-dependent dehydrogenase (short-subunit alcohol dehydrogenase family)